MLMYLTGIRNIAASFRSRACLAWRSFDGMTRVFIPASMMCALAVACGSDETAVGTTGPWGDASAGAGGAASRGFGGPNPSGGASGGTSRDGAPRTVNVFIDVIKSGPSSCLPRALETSGSTICRIIEATTNASDATCTAAGRATLSPTLIDAARNDLEAKQFCGTDAAGTVSDCNAYHLCEIVKADASCLTVTPSPSTIGWCYVDPSMGLGDPALVAQCPSTMTRIIRFVGADTPAPGAITMIACAQGI